MKDSYGTYDGRLSEPPYACPGCAEKDREIARLTGELAHVERSLAWQQDERRKAEAGRDEAQAELARVRGLK